MWKKLLSLLSDASLYGLSTVAGQLVSFLLLPLYTRHLSPADYGILAMLNVALMLTVGLAPLGVVDAIFRRLSLCRDMNDKRRELSTALWSVVGSTTLFLTCGLLSASILSRILVGDVSSTHYVRVTLLTASLIAIGEVPRALLRANRKVWILALVSLCKVSVTIAFTAYAIVALEKGVLGYVLANLLSELLFVLVFGALVFRSFSLSFCTSAWRAMLKYGLPILPHRCLAFITLVFGQYTVRQLMGLEQAGLYDMANKFALPLGMLINAFQSAWHPFKFQIHAEETSPTDFFRSAFTYYVAMTACLWVVGSCWLPDVLRYMTTPGFYPAATFLPVVLLVRVLTGVYYMLGSGIELSDNTRPLALISACGLVTVASFSYLLIPAVGAQGAAYANCIGWIAMGAVALQLANSRIYIGYEWKVIFLIAMSAIVFVTIAVQLQTSDALIRILAGTIVSLAFPVIVLSILARYSGESGRVRRRLAMLYGIAHAGSVSP